MAPVDGGRELRVTSSDGGSTLRATNFYSKIAGGALNFYALIANTPGSPIRNGQLVLKKFEVRDEATLAELDRRGRPKKSGPRAEGVTFKKLSLPFSTDAQFVRMCNVTLEGPDLGGVAEGLVRKVDGAIDITGTMVPAQGLNGFLDDVPLFGQILTGGKGGGVLRRDLRHGRFDFQSAHAGQSAVGAGAWHPARDVRLQGYLCAASDEFQAGGSRSHQQLSSRVSGLLQQHVFLLAVGELDGAVLDEAGVSTSLSSFTASSLTRMPPPWMARRASPLEDARPA